MMRAGFCIFTIITSCANFIVPIGHHLICTFEITLFNTAISFLHASFIKKRLTTV